MKNQKSSSAHTTTNRTQQRPRQWWLEHYQAWAKSGLSRPEYCEAHGLKYSSFYNWAHRFQKSTDVVPGKPDRKVEAHAPFVQALIVAEPSAPAPISLTIRDVTVRFDSGLPPQDLAVWVRSLRALPC
jgi:hypothetical protein